MTSSTASITQKQVVHGVNVVLGGLLGLVAAIVMGFFATAIGGLLLISAISQLAVSAATAQSTSGLVIGILLHLIFGIIFGIVFAFIYGFITTEDKLATGLLLGILYGIALYVINFLVLGRFINVALLSVPSLIAISSHIVYGLVLGFYPVLDRDTGQH